MAGVDRKGVCLGVIARIAAGGGRFLRGQPLEVEGQRSAKATVPVGRVYVRRRVREEAMTSLCTWGLIRCLVLVGHLVLQRKGEAQKRRETKMQSTPAYSTTNVVG